MANQREERAQTIHARSVLWLVVSVVLLISGTVAVSLSREDIRFWDESAYLERGLSLGFGSTPGWEWNPLYSDTYWIAHTIFNDPITAYFAVRALTASMVVIAVWAAVRLFSNGLIALAAGVVMMCLPVTYVWPGVSTPAAAVLILGTACAWRLPRPISWLVANLALWLAAAFRPEFVWAALLTTAVTLIATVADRYSNFTWRARLAAVVGVILPGLVLAWGYGNPMKLGTRSWEAFSQHYEYRYAQPGEDPWQIGEAVVETHFPGASSVLEALMVGPAYLMEHVMSNILQLPISLVGHAAGLGGPSTLTNVLGLAASLTWWTGVVLALAFPWTQTRKMFRSVARIFFDRRQFPVLVITAITVAFAVIPLVLIYPRPHYLTILVGASVAIAGIVLSRTGVPAIKRWLPLATTLLIGATTVGVSVFTLITSSESVHPNADALRKLNAADISWNLLTPERPILPYFRNAEAVTSDPSIALTFSEYLDTTHTNVIFDGILFRTAPYSAMPDFERFLSNPGDFRFRRVTEGSEFFARETKNS